MNSKLNVIIGSTLNVAIDYECAQTKLENWRTIFMDATVQIESNKCCDWNRIEYLDHVYFSIDSKVSCYRGYQFIAIASRASIQCTESHCFFIIRIIHCIEYRLFGAHSQQFYRLRRRNLPFIHFVRFRYSLCDICAEDAKNIWNYRQIWTDYR